VRNIFEDAKDRQAVRLEHVATPTTEALRTLEAEDIPDDLRKEGIEISEKKEEAPPALIEVPNEVKDGLVVEDDKEADASDGKDDGGGEEGDSAVRIPEAWEKEFDAITDEYQAEVAEAKAEHEALLAKADGPKDEIILIEAHQEWFRARWARFKSDADGIRERHGLEPFDWSVDSSDD